MISDGSMYRMVAQLLRTSEIRSFEVGGFYFLQKNGNFGPKKGILIEWQIPDPKRQFSRMKNREITFQLQNERSPSSGGVRISPGNMINTSVGSFFIFKIKLWNFLIFEKSWSKNEGCRVKSQKWHVFLAKVISKLFLDIPIGFSPLKHLKTR